MKTLTPTQQNKNLEKIKDELIEQFIGKINFEVEERQYGRNLVYYFRSIFTDNEGEVNNYLEGYFGYPKGEKEPGFYVLDWGRVHWAEQEGFSEKQMHEKVGVFNSLKSQKDFAKFLLKKKSYKVKEYGILSPL
jgi:hypothetical protein